MFRFTCSCVGVYRFEFALLVILWGLMNLEFDLVGSLLVF